MLMYLKSSISLSCYDGCSIGCKYCILSTLENRQTVKKICEEQDIIEELLNYRFYSPEIPLTINNITEPFLNETVFKSTIKLLKLIEKNKLKNPCVVITKGYLSDEQIKIIAELKDIQLIVLYTFSGISETFENRNEKKQIETIEKLSKLKNVNLMHYYRPVIEGINTDIETIKKVVNMAVKYFKGSIVAGIRINSHIKSIFDELKIAVPFEFDTEHKVILTESYNKILETFKEVSPNYPCFKKTSCGIGYVTGRPDYNGHSARLGYCKETCPSYHICFNSGTIGFCKSDCPNYEICKAESEKQVTKEEVETLLTKIGKNSPFEIKESHIFVDDTLTQEEISYLRHTLKKNVKAKKTIRCNNEDKLSQ